MTLLLHFVYNLPCTAYSHIAAEVVQSVEALKKYGFPVHIFLQPDSQLYNLILHYAPVQPLDMYTLAASHDLDELATAISAYTLSLHLSELTDTIVVKIGAVYVRRLVFLHLGRIAALKRLLAKQPEFHGPTAACGFPEQRQLMRDWNNTTAGLAWEVRAGM